MAAPKGGFTGRILDINLTTGESKTRELDDAIARQFLGGTGLATYFLYKEVPTGADPMGPENLLIFASGPLCGTECPGSRLSVNFKSPISGGLGNAYVGGAVSPEIKWAGWDMIILRGKAPKLCYVSVRDDKVEIRDASKMAGKDTLVSEEMIKEDLKDPDAKCLVIGPAGENLQPLACIISERVKAAGRLGSGAVMGSKNVKGFAVHGTKYVPLANKDAFHKLGTEAVEMNAQNDRAPGFRQYGTAISLDQNSWISGSYATRNYQTAYNPDVSHMGSEEAERYFWQKHAACMGCQVHCMKIGVLRDSEKFEGLIAEGPEYESGVMEGSNIGLSSLDEVMSVIEMCDAMGVDNVGTGNLISFLMELRERDIIKPDFLDGLDPQFGDAESAKKIIDAIAYKKGKAGELLGQGIYAVVQKIGGDVKKYAMMARKQGIAAWDPRGVRGMLITYLLGPRGGVHTDGGSPAQVSERVASSSCCLCYFVPATWRKKSNSIIVDMLNAACGWNMTMDEYDKLGRRVITLQRAYSHREAGDDRNGDMPPDRIFEPLPDGPKAGAKWTMDEVNKAMDDYYAFFGWEKNGLPSEQCLKNYGLDFCLDSLKK